MSIYYKSKSHPRGSIVQSEMISPENVRKLFDSDYRGFSWAWKKTIPMTLITWDGSPRFSGKFETHKKFGKVFVPNSIMATNGKLYYFIVLLDGKVGIRRWPGYASKNEYKLDHLNVSADEVAMLERCLARVLEEVAPTKSIEQRYKRVKGTALKYESLFEFMSIVLKKLSIAKTLAKEVFEVAENPVAYFSKNEAELRDKNIDEPESNLYRMILILRLEQQRKLAWLDWKSSVEEVNSELKTIIGKRVKTIVEPKGNYKNTFVMLKSAGKMLKDLELVGISIATDADAYAIIVVKHSDSNRIQSLAKLCKLKVEVL